MGLFVGRYTLPDMLYNMEAQHYILPTKLRPPISETEWGMTALMVLLSIFICLHAYRKAARRRSRHAVAPQAPQGCSSRVLLERWTALWSKLSFNTKMIVRNIARNKGRTLVAMIGLDVLQHAHHLRHGLAGFGSRLRGDYGNWVAYPKRQSRTWTTPLLRRWKLQETAKHDRGGRDGSL